MGSTFLGFSSTISSIFSSNCSSSVIIGFFSGIFFFFNFSSFSSGFISFGFSFLNFSVFGASFNSGLSSGISFTFGFSPISPFVIISFFSSSLGTFFTETSVIFASSSTFSSSLGTAFSSFGCFSFISSVLISGIISVICISSLGRIVFLAFFIFSSSGVISSIISSICSSSASVGISFFLAFFTITFFSSTLPFSSFSLIITALSSSGFFTSNASSAVVEMTSVIMILS